MKTIPRIIRRIASNGKLVFKAVSEHGVIQWFESEKQAERWCFDRRRNFTTSSTGSGCPKGGDKR